jgi:hypothetical protein
MTVRVKLPNRRRQISQTAEWGGAAWIVSVGFDDAARAREIFVRGLKIGSAMDSLMDDACVMLSLLLQSGYGVGDVMERLGREGHDGEEGYASALGYLASVALGMETEVRAATACAAE